jgi:hypothetical protein
LASRAWLRHWRWRRNVSQKFHFTLADYTASYPFSDSFNRFSQQNTHWFSAHASMHAITVLFDCRKYMHVCVYNVCMHVCTLRSLISLESNCLNEHKWFV